LPDLQRRDANVDGEDVIGYGRPAQQVHEPRVAVEACGGAMEQPRIGHAGQGAQVHVAVVVRIVACSAERVRLVAQQRWYIRWPYSRIPGACAFEDTRENTLSRKRYVSSGSRW
jgi:hypothetical protein